MPKLSASLGLVIYLAGGLGALSCEGDYGIGVKVDYTALAYMKQRVLATIGDAACQDSVDCRYIAIGDKPCGGPWEYVVYSASGCDTTALHELVREYNDFERRLNEKYHWASQCDWPQEPIPACREGRCVAVGYK